MRQINRGKSNSIVFVSIISVLITLLVVSGVFVYISNKIPKPPSNVRDSPLTSKNPSEYTQVELDSVGIDRDEIQEAAKAAAEEDSGGYIPPTTEEILIGLASMAAGIRAQNFASSRLDRAIDNSFSYLTHTNIIDDEMSKLKANVDDLKSKLPKNLSPELQKTLDGIDDELKNINRWTFMK